MMLKIYHQKVILISLIALLCTACLFTKFDLTKIQPFDYVQAGYIEVHIGDYSLYLPSRFETDYNLISKINSKLIEENYNGYFYIDIPNKKFFLEAEDYFLFSFVEKPKVNRYDSINGGTFQIPSPDHWANKFYINAVDFWQENLEYDAYLREYWLYQNEQYVLKISFASALRTTKKEIQHILSSVTKQEE